MGKVFKLTMVERFAVLSALPKEGSYATLRVLRDLQHQLAPSEEESKEMELKQEGERVKMNSKAGEERDLDIGERGEDLIFRALQELNRNEKLQEHQFGIYEKFVKKRQESE